MDVGQLEDVDLYEEIDDRPRSETNSENLKPMQDTKKGKNAVSGGPLSFSVFLSFSSSFSFFVALFLSMSFSLCLSLTFSSSFSLCLSSSLSWSLTFSSYFSLSWSLPFSVFRSFYCILSLLNSLIEFDQDVIHAIIIQIQGITFIHSIGLTFQRLG